MFEDVRRRRRTLRLLKFGEKDLVSTQQAARIHGRIRDVNGVLHYLRRPGIKGVLRVALNDEGNLGASAQGLPNAEPRAHILAAFYGRIVELPNQRKRRGDA